MFESPPPSFSRSLLWTALVLAGGVAAYVVYSGVSSRATDAEHLKQHAQAQSVVTVTLISPTPANATPTLELPGRIEAFTKAPIYARISGYLKSWKADIGTSVRAGQLLAEIDTPDLDQQILQAKAELASTQANAALSENTAQRWQSLLATNFVSSQAVEEKLGDYKAKQAIVAASQANVSRIEAMKNFSRIVSPFDGVVTARNTDVGALINAGGNAGSELFVVSDIKRLRLYVNLPQNYVAQIQKGAIAKFTVPETPGKIFIAKVISTSQAITAGSGSMLVQLSADNPSGTLLPGGFATVSFDLPGTSASLSVPPSALIFTKAGLRVATVTSENKVVLKTVVIGRDYGNKVELSSGLDASDRLIESPPDGVTDGDVVKVAVAEPKKP
jgi:membrane fusion protein, multidrug efflux system